MSDLSGTLDDLVGKHCCKSYESILPFGSERLTGFIGCYAKRSKSNIISSRSPEAQLRASITPEATYFYMW